jgi:hypothetical protein
MPSKEEAGIMLVNLPCTRPYINETIGLCEIPLRYMMSMFCLTLDPTCSSSDYASCLECTDCGAGCTV